MKKLLFIAAALIGFAMTSHAQTAVQLPLVAGDTVTNTGTVTKTFQVTAGYSGIVIQPVFTKISGTVAGTATLLASNDGINFVATGDTYTLTDIAKPTTVWIKTAPNAAYYKFSVTGSGTMSAGLKIFLRFPKYNP